MKRFISLVLASLAICVLAGCGTNYDVYYNASGVSPLAYIPCARNERPKFVEGMDLKALVDRNIKGYVGLGSLRLNGSHQKWKDIIDFAKAKGATLVLYCAYRDGNIEHTRYVPVHHTSTSYHSGSLNGGYYGDSYTYSGTTTTSTTSWREHNYTVNNYEHLFLFLAKKS